MSAPAAPILKYLMSFDVEVGEAVIVVGGPVGRRFIPITGGTVSGGLTGRIRSGGGDWQSVDTEGDIELDAHYILDIEGHGPVEVRSTGARTLEPQSGAALAQGEAVDPSKVYFRTLMRFRSDAHGLNWMNHRLFLTTGRREASHVLLEIFELS